VGAAKHNLKGNHNTLTHQVGLKLSQGIVIRDPITSGTVLIK